MGLAREVGGRGAAEAELGGGGGGAIYAAVAAEDADAAPPRGRARRAWVSPVSAAALAAAGALLVVGALLRPLGHRAPAATQATPEEAALEVKLAVSPEPFSCAKYGCLDVRAGTPCGCSQHCLQDGNCCPDFRATCSPQATRARLGAWVGCRAPGPLRPPPGGWGYRPHGPAVQVKVLSFNPEWWHVIEQLRGNGNSIAKVIAMASHPLPFDFIGFQEFYDPWYGLTRPGFDASWLLSQYMFIRGEVGGPVGTVIGFRNESWALLERGQRFVAEDRRGPNYFGRRIALWARFQHKQTGKTVFLMNHHGPLPANTGGVCGGYATAGNLLHTIAESAKLGDAIVLVGDFNANYASVTIKQLSTQLHRCFGGIDNIFTSLPPGAVVRKVNLPSGGSDHAAIAVLLQLAAGPP